MKFWIDVKLTGYEQVCVDAKTREEAFELARDRFWEIYTIGPAINLRQKTTEYDVLGDD